MSAHLTPDGAAGGQGYDAVNQPGGRTGLTMKDKLALIAEWCREDRRLWDVLTAMRGPDAGLGQPCSERPIDRGETQQTRYNARVARKLDTVAILRYAALGEIHGARCRKHDRVVLPPSDLWDHFDKHVARAATVLGIAITEKG